MFLWNARRAFSSQSGTEYYFVTDYKMKSKHSQIAPKKEGRAQCVVSKNENESKL